MGRAGAAAAWRLAGQEAAAAAWSCAAARVLLQRPLACPAAWQGHAGCGGEWGTGNAAERQQRRRRNCFETAAGMGVPSPAGRGGAAGPAAAASAAVRAPRPWRAAGRAGAAWLVAAGTAAARGGQRVAAPTQRAAVAACLQCRLRALKTWQRRFEAAGGGGAAQAGRVARVVGAQPPAQHRARGVVGRLPRAQSGTARLALLRGGQGGAGAAGRSEEVAAELAATALPQRALHSLPAPRQIAAATGTRGLAGAEGTRGLGCARKVPPPPPPPDAATAATVAQQPQA